MAVMNNMLHIFQIPTVRRLFFKFSLEKTIITLLIFFLNPYKGKLFGF